MFIERIVVGCQWCLYKGLFEGRLRMTIYFLPFPSVFITLIIKWASTFTFYFYVSCISYTERKLGKGKKKKLIFEDSDRRQRDMEDKHEKRRRV